MPNMSQTINTESFFNIQIAQGGILTNLNFRRNVKHPYFFEKNGHIYMTGQLVGKKWIALVDKILKMDKNCQ